MHGCLNHSDLHLQPASKQSSEVRKVTHSTDHPHCFRLFQAALLEGTTSVYRNWALEMFAVQAMVTCDFFELVGLLNALAS